MNASRDFAKSSKSIRDQLIAASLKQAAASKGQKPVFAIRDQLIAASLKLGKTMELVIPKTNLSAIN